MERKQCVAPFARDIFPIEFIKYTDRHHYFINYLSSECVANLCFATSHLMNEQDRTELATAEAPARGAPDSTHAFDAPTSNGFAVASREHMPPRRKCRG